MNVSRRTHVAVRRSMEDRERRDGKQPRWLGTRSHSKYILVHACTGMLAHVLVDRYPALFVAAASMLTGYTPRKPLPFEFYYFEYNPVPLMAAQVLLLIASLAWAVVFRPALWAHFLAGIAMSGTSCLMELIALASRGMFEFYSFAAVCRELAPLLVAGPVMTVAARFVIPKSRWVAERRSDPVCRRCSYNLTGNVSGRCPECGQRVV